LHGLTRTEEFVTKIELLGDILANAIAPPEKLSVNTKKTADKEYERRDER